jgi:hypothetical protein
MPTSARSSCSEESRRRSLSAYQGRPGRGVAASGTRLALSFSRRAGCRSRSSAACGSCRRAAIRWLPRPARRLSGEQRPGRRAPAAADRSPGNGPGSTVTGARVMPIQMRRAPGRRALPGRECMMRSRPLWHGCSSGKQQPGVSVAGPRSKHRSSRVRRYCPARTRSACCSRADELADGVRGWSREAVAALVDLPTFGERGDSRTCRGRVLLLRRCEHSAGCLGASR